ncbi:hypothetical protein KCV07_g3766, partial [Aureobasidium melanogenum]
MSANQFSVADAAEDIIDFSSPEKTPNVVSESVQHDKDEDIIDFSSPEAPANVAPESPKQADIVDDPFHQQSSTQHPGMKQSQTFPLLQRVNDIEASDAETEASKFTVPFMKTRNMPVLSPPPTQDKTSLPSTPSTRGKKGLRSVLSTRGEPSVSAQDNQSLPSTLPTEGRKGFRSSPSAGGKKRKLSHATTDSETDHNLDATQSRKRMIFAPERKLFRALLCCRIDLDELMQHGDWVSREHAKVELEGIRAKFGCLRSDSSA